MTSLRTRDELRTYQSSATEHTTQEQQDSINENNNTGTKTRAMSRRDAERGDDGDEQERYNDDTNGAGEEEELYDANTDEEEGGDDGVELGGGRATDTDRGRIKRRATRSPEGQTRNQAPRTGVTDGRETGQRSVDTGERGEETGERGEESDTMDGGGSAWAVGLLRAWSSGDRAELVDDGWRQATRTGEWTPVVRAAAKHVGKKVAALSSDAHGANEWTIRTLVTENWTASAVRKHMQRLLQGSATAPADLFWAAVAALQESGAVRAGVTRYRNTEHGARPEAGWKQLLLINAELHDDARRWNDVHKASGMPRKEVIRARNLLTIRGPEWRAPVNRTLRRSRTALEGVEATMSTSHGRGSEGDAGKRRSVQLLLLAEIAAGRLDCQGYIPRQTALDKLRAGSDDLPGGAVGLTDEQIEALERARDGAVLAPVLTESGVELTELMTGCAGATAAGDGGASGEDGRRRLRPRNETRAATARPEAKCAACLAQTPLYVDTEHPRASRRWRVAGGTAVEGITEATTFTHCGDGESVLMKATTTYNNIFSKDRRCRLRCCNPSQRAGGGEFTCDSLAEPPTGDSKGGHQYTVGQDRSLAGCFFRSADIKHHVPQMYFADVAAAIAERHGAEFAQGRGWVSVCAGSHSDRLAAQRAGYFYVPLDIQTLVAAFQGYEPNWYLDATKDDVFGAALRAVGGDNDRLAAVAVVHFGLPCETDSQLNPGLHWEQDGTPRTERAAEVDAIERNFALFIERLRELKAERGAECTCGRRPRAADGT